tara:strand:- start:2946 stop:4622 length:1677 start_codon:yes stop_codon:yes gene_type:complete
MARENVIYNCQALYVGPAPETEYNFLNYGGGAPTNDHTDLHTKINRLHSVDRIQSISYEISIPHTDINQLNKRGIVDRPIINPPTVNLNFDYLLCGTKNEARLGLNVNYPLFNFPFDGAPYYSNNSSVSLLSGFFEPNKNAKTRRWWQDFPENSYRDCKNIYVAVNPEGNDIDQSYYKEDFTQADLYQGIDDNAPNYHVISFGNCYLNSYSTRGAVGTVPGASVSYTAYNVNFDSSGSGFLDSNIETKSGTISPSKDVVIPRVLAEEGYAALSPGDITISTDSFSGLGVDFDKLYIQSYNIDISLNKEPLNNLGYKFPVDNRPNSPVFASLSLNGIVESGNAGSLIDLISINSGYDFTIKVDPKGCTGSTAAPINAGAIPIKRKDEALRYSFVGAKLNNFSYNTAIGDNKVFDASFNVEIDPDDQTNGFFMSGVLGAEKVEDFILLEEPQPAVFINNPAGYSFGATSMTVLPLASDIPIGTILYFPGSDEFLLTSAAVKNATTIVSSVGLSSSSGLVDGEGGYRDKGIWSNPEMGADDKFYLQAETKELLVTNLIPLY